MKNLPDKIYLSFGEMSEDRFEKEDYKEFCEQHNNLVDFLKNKFWETDVDPKSKVALDFDKENAIGNMIWDDVKHLMDTELCNEAEMSIEYKAVKENL